MSRPKCLGRLFLAVFSVLVLSADGRGAPIFSGSLYYTRFSSPPNNVATVDYSYDAATQILTFSNHHNIASPAGADGVIFAPNGHLLVGGAGSNRVFEMTAGGTAVTDVAAGGNAYHVSLNPAGTTLYTSPFGGPLATIPIVGGLAGPATTHAITGSERGVTQIAFDGAGNSYYVTGSPNGFGNFGTINLSTFATSRILTGERSIHGIQYDPFTGRLTFFGTGAVGTIVPGGGAGTFQQRVVVPYDFDQGSVDGFGHAFIAGGGQITFIDYSATGDITSPLNTILSFSGANGLSFANIDDLAPLAGPGSAGPEVPAPPTILVFAIGGVTVLGSRLVRRRAVAV